MSYLIDRTCACRCGCKREIAHRERRQTISRCVRCRKDPTLTCQRPYHPPPPRVPSPGRRVIEPFTAALPVSAEESRKTWQFVDATMARLKRERRGVRWSGGQA